MVTHTGRREGVRERRLHDDGKQVCQCDLHTGETLAGLRERNHTRTHTQRERHIHPLTVHTLAMLHKHTKVGGTQKKDRKRHGVAAIQRQQLFLKTTAEAEHDRN